MKTFAEFLEEDRGTRLEDRPNNKDGSKRRPGKHDPDYMSPQERWNKSRADAAEYAKKNYKTTPIKSLDDIQNGELFIDGSNMANVWYNGVGYSIAPRSRDTASWTSGTKERGNLTFRGGSVLQKITNPTPEMVKRAQQIVKREMKKDKMGY